MAEEVTEKDDADRDDDDQEDADHEDDHRGGETLDYVPDAEPVTMLVIPEDKMEEAKDALAKLAPRRETSDDDRENNGGDGELSGTGCRRTKQRDWVCGDTD
jgi:hypothetical protein